MTRATLLIVPLGLAVVALETGQIAAKLGVPLSCALILAWAIWKSPARRRDGLWVVAAFCFSAGGDWFLANRGGREGFFLAGIGLFFVAHAGYLAFACRQGRLGRKALGVLLSAYLLYYFFGLHPAIRSTPVATAALMYLLISCATLSAAWGMRMPGWQKWPFVAGIALLVFSDTIISFSEFLGWKRWNGLILPTYYLVHPCVSWTVLGQCFSVSRATVEGPAASP